MRLRRCQRCGHELLPDALYCKQCGEPTGITVAPNRGHRLTLQDEEEVSDRSRLVALLLCALLGYLGLHRFYVGKFLTGFLWLVTGGLFGVGYIIDTILIAAGAFRDRHGLRLIYWDEAPP
jgi:hypothetical protein